MINILNKDLQIPNRDYQDRFNLKVINDLFKYGVEYDKLVSNKQHKVLMKYLSISNPDVIRKGFIAPQYVNSPDIIVVNRAPTMNDLKYINMQEIKNPSTQVIMKLIQELDFSRPYITSLAFHATKSFNEWTLDKLKREFLYKDLEFDTIELPQVFLLLGNDAMNCFYNTDNTVQGIFGDIYLSEYKGDERLFIPIPHPAYLLREPNLLKNTVQFLRYIRLILQKIKKEV